MRSTIILSLAAVATASIFKRAECDQDNCLRDIQGTHDGLLPVTIRSSDCSSFMGITAMAQPSTTTLTLTVWADEVSSSASSGCLASTPASTLASTPASTPASTLASTPASTLASTPASTPASTLASTPASTPVPTSTPTPTPSPSPAITLAKRDDEAAIPTNPLPTYATWCENNAQYYSACSCWGIVATTTTTPASMATETATVTISKDWCDC